jgi:hypothetical protein
VTERTTVAAALTLLAALTGCDTGPVHACPAIGWTNQLVVELAPDWRPVEGGTVHLECPSACGVALSSAGAVGPVDEVSAPLSGSAASLLLDMTAPDSVVVTVLGADGAALAELDADLDWTRVGGSAECGGPVRATLTVPAP